MPDKAETFSHPDVWSGYLSFLKLMLPYFSGTWNRAYTTTRLVSLFIQEIESLDNFTKQQFEDGNFVVRRTEKAYAGISVEQSLIG